MKRFLRQALLQIMSGLTPRSRAPQPRMQRTSMWPWYATSATVKAGLLIVGLHVEESDELDNSLRCGMVAERRGSEGTSAELSEL